MYTHICACICVYIYIYIYIYFFFCFIYIYTYICVCLYICIHIYLYYQYFVYIILYINTYKLLQIAISCYKLLYIAINCYIFYKMLQTLRFALKTNTGFAFPALEQSVRKSVPKKHSFSGCFGSPNRVILYKADKDVRRPCAQPRTQFGKPSTSIRSHGPSWAGGQAHQWQSTAATNFAAGRV